MLQGCSRVAFERVIWSKRRERRREEEAEKRERRERERLVWFGQSTAVAAIQADMPDM